MNYSETLADYLKKCGLSHREVSRRCKELGTPVSQAYISQLAKGDVPPPSEEVTRILAQVLDCEADKLIWLGYIDKAPEAVRPIIRHYVEKLDSYEAFVASMFYDAENDEEDDARLAEFATKFRDMMQQQPLEHRADFIIKMFNRTAVAHPDWLIEFGQDLGVENGNIQNTIQKAAEAPLCRIPVLDMENDATTYDWIAASKIRFGDYMYLVAPDDSMSGANIMKGSKLLVKTINEEYCFHEFGPDYEYKQPNDALIKGKIYLVEYNKDILIRRVYKALDGTITLVAENPKYPPIVVGSNDDFELDSLVVSVEFNPNED